MKEKFIANISDQLYAYAEEIESQIEKFAREKNVDLDYALLIFDIATKNMLNDELHWKLLLESNNYENKNHC